MSGFGIGIIGKQVVKYGAYRVSGTLTVAGAPAQRRVFLFEYPAIRLIDDTWSDHAGLYAFDNIPETPQGGARYGVLGYDHTGQYDPECKIGFSVEAMP